MSLSPENEVLQLKLASPAKLNLLLSISPKVEGGKHLLTSVFTTINFCDFMTFSFDASAKRKITVEVKPVSQPGLSDPLNIPPEQNIAYKAVRALEASAGRRLDGHLHIKIEKWIPHEAGLGGGSSNAATTLIALCRLWNLDAYDDAVLRAAQSLGADVSFFLYGGCALMGGHGEKLLRQLPKPCMGFVLVRPSAGVSTTAAYAAFDSAPQPPPNAQALADLLEGGGTRPYAEGLLPDASYSKAHYGEIAELMANNLAPAAISLNPEIQTLVDDLEATTGVCKAMLTGSGSVVFAVCETGQLAVRIAKRFAACGYWAKAASTRSLH